MAEGNYQYKVAWEGHVEHMTMYYGRQDPECFWCGRPVFWSMQGLYGGGAWTTIEDEEGPRRAVSAEGAFCRPSLDGNHDVLPMFGHVVGTDSV
jgi:hypothetical protein